MSTIQHRLVTDPNIHEPKGVSTAAANTVYLADGAGSGDWEFAKLEGQDGASTGQYPVKNGSGGITWTDPTGGGFGSYAYFPVAKVQAAGDGGGSGIHVWNIHISNTDSTISATPIYDNTNYSLSNPISGNYYKNINITSAGIYQISISGFGADETTPVSVDVQINGSFTGYPVKIDKSGSAVIIANVPANGIIKFYSDDASSVGEYRFTFLKVA